ncbi:MAG: hypothetical protein RIR88_199, partial [Actinomycetota bacterium]
MSPLVGLSLALGIGLGSGLWLVLLSLPRFGALPLHQRIAPYVADISATAFDDVTRHSGTSRFQRAFGVRSLTAAISNVVHKTPAASALVLNLHRAGWSVSDGEFRVRRLLWAILGVGAGGVLVAAAGITVHLSELAVVALPLLMGCSAYVAVTLHLHYAATRRLRHIE